MYRIQTLNKISSAGLSVLDKKYFQISDTMEQPHGIMVRSAAMGDYEFPKQLPGFRFPLLAQSFPLFTAFIQFFVVVRHGCSSCLFFGIPLYCIFRYKTRGDYVNVS